MGKTTDRSTSVKAAPRQQRASAPTSFPNEHEDSSDEIQDDEEEAEDEQMDTDMLKILAELQKRKSKKSGKNTSGSALHTQKAILYAKARQRAFDAVKEGHAYLDRALDQMGQLKHQEGAYRKHVQDFSPLYNASDVSVQSLLALYPYLLQDLSPRRTEELDDASAMVLEHPAEREQSRKRLMRHARAQIKEGLENQRVATDAAALIKNYKTLLLA